MTASPAFEKGVEAGARTAHVEALLDAITWMEGRDDCDTFHIPHVEAELGRRYVEMVVRDTDFPLPTVFAHGGDALVFVYREHLGGKSICHATVDSEGIVWRNWANANRELIPWDAAALRAKIEEMVR